MPTLARLSRASHRDLLIRLAPNHQIANTRPRAPYMLQRMRELAVQSSNASNTSVDRTSLDNEFQQLTSEITRTMSATKFNGTAIIGSGAGNQTFQVGANNSSNDQLTVTTTDMTASTTMTTVTATT